MTDAATARSHGKVFDTIAAEYDRNRPSYPDELVEHACTVAGLTPGDPVLELGCGTGQLTRSLLARGLKVTALEPGERLIALATEKLATAGDVSFINKRLEDAQLPQASYRAVFAASSFHWMDPDVSWRAVADALAPNGVFALLQYFGLREDWNAADDEACRAALARVADGLDIEWPTYHDLEGTLAGIEQRAANVSEVWGWLGGYELAREFVPSLFGPAQAATVPIRIEQSAAEMNALLRTMSFWARLPEERRQELERENESLFARLGRPIRASAIMILLTARKR